jgi:hypothetical protein
MTHGTMGLLGDLCGEAEYLWKRLATVHVALDRCNNAGLRRRFSFELKVHIERCQEMKVVVSNLELLGLSQSCQFYLLKELLRRALNESYAFSI